MSLETYRKGALDRHVAAHEKYSALNQPYPHNSIKREYSLENLGQATELVVSGAISRRKFVNQAPQDILFESHILYFGFNLFVMLYGTWKMISAGTTKLVSHCSHLIMLVIYKNISLGTSLASGDI